MSRAPAYTEYHPRWYRTRMSTYWWMYRWSYLGFILREVSSAFIAWFVVFTLLQIRALSRGAEGYRQFQSWTENPIVLLVNLVTLFFVVFHSITWFNLAPKAMVVRMRGRRVPGPWIAGMNYAAWVLVSVVVAWIILKG